MFNPFQFYKLKVPATFTESSLSHEEKMKVYDKVKVLQQNARSAFRVLMVLLACSVVAFFLSWVVPASILLGKCVVAWFVGRHFHNKANRELLPTGVDLRSIDI